jgi:phenylacetic acid degradation operon negative regulatory protein
MSTAPELNPKRLILSLLRARDGEPLSTRDATAAAAVFGIRENHLRVALVRLGAAGLIEAAGRGSYRLAPSAELLAEEVGQWHAADERVCPWDGGWLMVSTGGLGRSDRPAMQARERALAMLGFRELAPTLYLRPDNLLGHAAAVRARLLKLGLDDSAPVFAARDFDPVREQRARQLWDADELNASYLGTRQKLEAWMARAGQIDLDVAARESYLLGNDAIRQLVFDPLLPEPLVDVAARRACIQAVQAFDQLGHGIWQRLLDQVHRGVPLGPQAAANGAVAASTSASRGRRGLND